MHRSKGGGIVDASMVLQVLMHQAGIDASSKENQASIDASLVTGTFHRAGKWLNVHPIHALKRGRLNQLKG